MPSTISSAYKDRAFPFNPNDKDNDGRNLLHLSSIAGDDEAIDSILKTRNGRDAINAQDNSGLTALYLAADNGHVTTVAMLIGAGADVDVCMTNSWYEMYQVARNGSRESKVDLIDKVERPLCTIEDPIERAYVGTNELYRRIEHFVLEDPHALKSFNELDAKSPLHVASSKGHTEIVELLLLHGAKVDFRDGFGRTSLYRAIDSNNIGCARVLIDFKGDPTLGTNRGETPLHAACRRGNMGSVTILLRVSNVNQGDNDGRTPIYVAAQYGHPEVIERLLAAGGDAGLSRNDGCSPLHIGSFYGFTDTVTWLLTASSDVNQQTTHGVTAAYLSAQNGHHHVTRVLQKRGANFNLLTKTGYAPIHVAAFNGHNEVLKSLLKGNANVNLKGHFENRAIHLASYGCHKDSVVTILSYNCDVNVEDSKGYTPLHCAILRCSTGIVNLLLMNGADTTIPDHTGMTPVDFCSHIKHAKIGDLINNPPNGDKILEELLGEVAPRIGFKWKELVRLLRKGADMRSEFHSIEHRHPGNLYQQAMDGLKGWKASVNWRVQTCAFSLTNALQRCNREDISDFVKHSASKKGLL